MSVMLPVHVPHFVVAGAVRDERGLLSRLVSADVLLVHDDARLLEYDPGIARRRDALQHLAREGLTGGRRSGVDPGSGATDRHGLLHL